MKRYWWTEAGMRDEDPGLAMPEYFRAEDIRERWNAFKRVQIKKELELYKQAERATSTAWTYAAVGFTLGACCVALVNLL